MCKHVLNAQVSIRSPCCKKWFDCAEWHQEKEDHPLLQTFEMVFVCKKCKKAFRKDAREFEDRFVPIPPYPIHHSNSTIHTPPGPRRSNANSISLLAFSDEYCPHCDNHFVLDALTPKASLNVEGEDARVDNRMIKDERQRQKEMRTIFDVEEAPHKLG